MNSNTHLTLEKGSSFVELLVALAIFMPLLTGLTYSYIQCSKFVFKETTFDKKVHSEYLLRAYMRQLMFDVDSHRLPIFPVVHPRGELQYADGSTIKVSAINMPATDSNAITGFEVDLQRSMYVIEVSPEYIRVCPRYEKSLLQEHTELLAISTSSISEVAIKVLNQDKSTLCKKIIILETGGALTTPQTITPTPNMLFVPLKRVYTLYRSKRGELRILTHKNNYVVENQRITSNLKKMNIRLLPAAKHGSSVLELDFQLIDDQKKKILLSHALSRLSLTQFIYERP